MRPTFVIADLHIGDFDMCSLKKENGHPLRPFSSIEEHDETIIANWNKVVPKDARVYVLGDVAQKKSDIEKIGRLNGSRKILIAGNHDIYPSSSYLKYFKDIRGTHRLENGILMSHIPIHPSSFGKAHKVNVHGHIHDKVVKINEPDVILDRSVTYNIKPDPRYFCVSCEHINYTPMELGAIEIEVFGFDSRAKALDELAAQAQELNMGY
jgi:calcineurin-like phosphoesterase family protein